MEIGKPRPEDVEINKVLLEFPLYTDELVQAEVWKRGYYVTIDRVQSWRQL